MDEAKRAPTEAASLVRIILVTNRVRAYLSPDNCLTLFEFVWERRYDSRIDPETPVILPLERKAVPMASPSGSTKIVYTQAYRCSGPAVKPVVFEDYVRPPGRRPDRVRFLTNQVFWERILTGHIHFSDQRILDQYLAALYQRYDRSGLPTGLEHHVESDCSFPNLPASLRS
jgi:hypothetical protein